MYTVGKLTKTKLTVAVLGLSSLLVGCDTESAKSDREIRKEVAATLVQRADQSATSLDQVASKLQTLVDRETAASSAGKVAATVNLAQTEMEQVANALAKVSGIDGAIQRIVLDLQQDATTISNTNKLIEGYLKQDPSATVAKLNKQIADARGGPGKDNWIGEGEVPIRTLSAITQDISRVEGEIAKLQESIKTKTAQRDKAMADSSDAQAKSQAAGGKESVDLFKQAAEFTRQASDLSNGIEVDQAALASQQHELEIAKGQKTAVSNAIAALEQQLVQVQDGFKSVQAKVEELKKQTQQELAGDGTALGENQSPRSVQEKADALAKLVDDSKAARSEANALLDKAIKHFDDAQTSAGKLRTEIQQKIDAAGVTPPPQKAAWDAIQKQFDPGLYTRQKCDALRVRGMLETSNAVLISARAKMITGLKQAVAGAKLSLPKSAGLDDSTLAADLKNATDQADIWLDQSEKDLDNILRDQNSLHITKMLTSYGRSKLALAKGDQAQAGKFFEAAVASRDLAIQNNQVLPALPSDLAPPPVVKEQTAPPADGTTPPAGTTPSGTTPAPGAEQPAGDKPAGEKPAPTDNPAGGMATPPAPGM